MAKTFKVTCEKKSAKGRGASPLKAGLGDTPVEFLLLDNEDSTCTVFGVSAAGNRLDISDVATLSVTSSDTSKVTVDAPVGMTFKMHANHTPGNLGKSDIEVVATWNDGSKGPFAFTLPVETKAGGPTGIIVVPGDPVPHE